MNSFNLIPFDKIKRKASAEDPQSDDMTQQYKQSLLTSRSNTIFAKVLLAQELWRPYSDLSLTPEGAFFVIQGLQAS